MKNQHIIRKNLRGAGCPAASKANQAQAGGEYTNDASFVLI